MSLPSFRIALRFLRARDARPVLTIVAIALGVALVCALDVVSRSMQLAFDEIIDTMAGRTALEVSAGDGGLLKEEVAAESRACRASSSRCRSSMRPRSRPTAAARRSPSRASTS